MKLGIVLKETKDKLEKNSQDSACLEAEMLLSFVLKKGKEFLYAHLEGKVSFWQNLRLKRLISRRRRGYPMAYLTGHKEFYGLDFIVNKKVLIPRPETEIIIEEALKNILNTNCQIQNTIIDVGTGSGCIVISLAKELQKRKKTGNFYGLDISRKALAIARKNAKKNGVEGCTHFLYSDLLNSIDKQIFNNPVIITANLPYLTLEQIKNSPTIQKEPKIALLSGVDGLEHYRRLFKQVKDIFNKFKQEIIVLCEIDETQAVAIKELVLNDFPGAAFEIIKDLGGFERIVKIKIG